MRPWIVSALTMVWLTGCGPPSFVGFVTEVERVADAWSSAGEPVVVELDGTGTLLVTGDGEQTRHAVLPFDIVRYYSGGPDDCSDWDATSRPTAERDFLLWLDEPAFAVAEDGTPLARPVPLCGEAPGSSR